MPLIRRRLIPLPFEHMPQMPSAVITHNLRPLHPERTVRKPLHSTRNRVKVCRPAAAGLELVVGFVEGRIAAGAGVDAVRRVVSVVGAGVRAFGVFFAEDAELFWLR